MKSQLCYFRAFAKRIFWSLFLLTSPFAQAGLVSVFKDEKGNTNWQYLANTAGGLLIIALSIAALILYLGLRKIRKANLALKAIRNVLEQRVEERTATLNESNNMLKETNRMLTGEIEQHRATTNRLRSSEAYIKNILESMPLILIGLDKDMNITQWNDRVEQATRIQHHFALGKNLWEVYPTISISPDQVKKVLDKKVPETIKHSQRGQYYFDITIYPLRDQAETGLVILVDDVTQRIIAENMLIQRDKMSSVGELASTMAHDIDIPLQAMIRDIEEVQVAIGSRFGLSQEDEAVKDVSARLTDASDEGKRAAKIISNLLEFSESRGDQKQPVQLQNIIDRTLDLASDVLSAPSGFHFKDIQVRKKYESGLPPLPCYEAELQQVFLSLFRHACNALSDAGNSRTPQLKIEISERYDALWVKVTHNGRGLNSREQQYIFEPFFSHHPEDEDYDLSKRLSFSYFIVTEHHNGQMAVTSDPEIGTTFHLHFQLGRN